MAKRAKKPPPPPDDDEEDDDFDEPEEVEADEDDEDEGEASGEEEEGAGEDAEYVACPVCRGKGRGCRYCDGYGDVHPDDVQAILKAQKKAGGMPTAVVAIVVCLVLGLGGAAFMIVRSAENQGGAADGGGAGDPAQPNNQANGGASSSSGGAAPATPTLRKQEVTDAIIDMKMFMKMKRPEGYQKVIEIGTKALPLAEDPLQKQNVLDLMATARAKLGQ